MGETAKALYAFFSSFGIPAYPEGSVPDGAEMPYIIYRLAKPDWNSSISSYATIYSLSFSFEEVLEITDQIGEAIDCGITLQTSDGCIALYKDSNFAQIVPQGQTLTQNNDDIRAIYLSMIMHAYTA